MRLAAFLLISCSVLMAQMRILRRPVAAAVASSSLKFASGSYAGDGNDNRAVVTGLSFTPKVVFVSCTVGVSSVVRTDSMAGDTSSLFVGGGGADRIQSITSDGFTVGTDISVNNGALNYQWWALGGTEVATGTYTGNGSDDRNITGVGFNPGFVMIVPSSAQSRYATYRGSNLSGDLSFSGSIAATANYIQSLAGSAQFQVGTNVAVNENASTYYWWAVDSASTSLGQGSYVGNATDNRNITGLSFDPTLVIVKWDAATWGYMRSTSNTGDESKPLDAESMAADFIQAFGTTSFQVGGNAYVNGDTLTYYYWYFRQTP